MSDDYKQIAIAMENRVIEIHDKGGRYFQTKIPKAPRSIKFDSFNSSLLCSGSGDEIYRLDL